MTPAPMTEREVQRLLDEMVLRTGPVRGAVVLSNDGLLVASSTRFGRENSEHLSALVAGVQGLARGACRRFGGGQLLHIVGLVWSGGYGVQRKVAGAEQVLRTPQEIFGMGLMGVGGLIAVAGGLLFLVVMLRAIARGRARRAPQPAR